MGIIYEKPGNDAILLSELFMGKKKEGKIIIVSAPSGSGKTTLVNFLISSIEDLSFSISCTTRKQRDGEIDGENYYFIEKQDFMDRINNGDFVECEEVYQGIYYGTLNSEIERLWGDGKHIIFDVDVKGGINIKNKFGDKALSIFISPPSLDELRKRLLERGKDNIESINNRMNKAQLEMTYCEKFDKIIINDNLEESKKQILDKVKDFLKK